MNSAGPTSKRELEQALDDLVVQAWRNDISVADGGYVLRHDGDTIPDFELVIYRLTKPPDDTD